MLNSRRGLRLWIDADKEPVLALARHTALDIARETQ
jgi:hypothetical protein